MKCKICSALLLMLMFVSVFPINVNAKEKHFEKQEIKGVSVIDETSLMRVDAKGNVGDEYVHIEIKIPTKLTEEQKELLRKFDQIEQTKPTKTSFFEKFKKKFTGK